MKPTPRSSVTPYSNTYQTTHNTKVEGVPQYPWDSGLLDTLKYDQEKQKKGSWI